MELNPYEAPREMQHLQRPKAKYLPALLVLLTLVVLASIGLVAHLRSARLQQLPTPKSTVPNVRTVSEGL